MNEYNQLKIRERICLEILKYLDDNCKDDLRYPSAYAEYQRQLSNIQSKIKGIEIMMNEKEEAIELMQKIIKPTPTTIGLKTATLFGKIVKEI